MNLLRSSEIREIFKQIKLVIFDLEGIVICNGLENGCKNYGECNYKKFHQLCSLIKKDKKVTAIITGAIIKEEQKNLLNVDYIIESSLDKVGKAKKLIDELGITFDECCFIADGLLDIPLLEKVLLPISVKKAKREVKRFAKYICEQKCILCELTELFFGVKNE